MSPTSRRKRSFLFFPTTWSKIVISLTIFAAGFAFFCVGKKIISLAQAPTTAAPLAPPAAPSQTGLQPVTHTPPVVGLHTPTRMEESSPSTVLPTSLAKKQTDLKAMNLHTLTSKRNYVYTFEGIATYRRVPCANAIVVVRVTVADKTQTAGGFTNLDGTYAVSVPVIAAANEPVDWVVEAHTAELKQAESIGRRIATEDTTEEVTLPTSLALLPQ
jgi:hypothetical protein